MTGEFTLNINRRPFKIKPNNIETAMIQKNFKTETMHLSQLRTLLLLGATVKPAVLFEIISKELRVLEALYEISLERPKADKEGRPILSLSTRYLKEYLKKEIYVSKTLAILQYFNLLEKIPAYDCRNLDELIFVSRNNEVRDYTRVVTQIRILPLDDSVFDKLEKRADRFKKKKFLKSAFSFESVALKEDIFLANKLFPQK